MLRGDKKVVCVRDHLRRVSCMLAHRCTIFLCHLDLEIDIDIQISISEKSSGWATNYMHVGTKETIYLI